MSLPAILFSLFQLTCIVTGAGSKNQRWWCSAYAWFIAILTIIYAVIIVILTILSLIIDKDAKMVEQFYAQKDIYDSFAASEMNALGDIMGSITNYSSAPMEVPTAGQMIKSPPSPPIQSGNYLQNEMFESDSDDSEGFESDDDDYEEFENDDYSEGFENDDYSEGFENDDTVVEHFTGTCGGPMTGGGSCGAPSW